MTGTIASLQSKVSLMVSVEGQLVTLYLWPAKLFEVNCLRKTLLCDSQPMRTYMYGFTSVSKTSEVFLCFVAIVRVRVYYVDFFVFFVLCHW